MAFAATVVKTFAGKQVNRCFDCHAFHADKADFPPIVDFSRAEIARPHPFPSHGWWTGILAAVAGSFTFLLFVGWVTKPTYQNLPRRPTLVPKHQDNFESNVPGVYVVGEAVGIPAINDAMRSGRAAAGAIAQALGISMRGPNENPPAAAAADVRPADLAAHGPSPTDLFDMIIVGCGPAGMGAALFAHFNRVKYLVLERLSIAETIVEYPRAKLVHGTTLNIDEYKGQDKAFLEEDQSKEALVAHWQQIVKDTGLVVHEQEEVTNIRRDSDVLQVDTTRATYRGRNVVIAIGVRGSPRKLGMTGESADRVFYNCMDPDQFQGKDILVVGGGNAGHEVAIALANPKLRNRVSFSYLAPQNVTVKNRDLINALAKTGWVKLYTSTKLAEIRAHQVVLAALDPPPENMTLTQWMWRQGRKLFEAARILAGIIEDAEGSKPASSQIEVANDVVFAMVGADPPTRFLAKTGIQMEVKGL
jgi:thioredoxin reductase